MNLDERTVVARIERLTIRELRLWVREGWVRPTRGERGPVFDEVDVARLRLLCELRKDMGLPSDAVAPVLTLLDQLHRTRRDLRRLTAAVDAQPGYVRRSVADALRARVETES